MSSRQYPKFLKVMPETLGLGFHELAYVVILLIVSAVLRINPVFNIVLIFVGIVGIKIVKKYFDLVGWLLPKKKQVFITDTDWGEK